jgi:hypothetical protein
MSTLRQRIAAFRARHALAEYRMLRRVASRAGYDLVKSGYYSPVPDLDALPGWVWSEPVEMPGLAWDLPAQLAYVEQELGPLMAELGATSEPPGTAEGYFYRNEFFNALDADVLYATVRRLRPPRVVEVGSGFSTLVIAAAAERNRAEGSPLRHQVYDPFPSSVLGPVRDRLELAAIPAEAIEVEHFADLRAGELLFIDTTHTVRPAGDVVHLLLGALPRVGPDVTVHIHDFFRPFEYPRVLMEHYGSYWQEHHLLQALLVGNAGLEILCANHALARLHRERMRALVPGLDPDMHPSSLWLRTAVAPGSGSPG